ncbi:MAG: hypothetical protein K9M44_02515 [Candidatus Pacebacteria bacterium]|nr:hypothetical protein [Candidatus Paceibacterota bacterium]
MENKENKFHLIAVDMGYGHQRAAYPLISFSSDGIVTANNYKGIDPKERKSWQGNKKGYELVSYFKKLPLVGDLVFSAMDYFQKIDSFYPKRDLSKPSFQQKYFYKKIEKGLGKKLIEKLNQNPLPLVTTFFVVAYFAEYYDYKGEIYCVVCDADVSRAWAPLNPSTSKIKYLAPNKRVKERLVLYGVRPENIFVAGFPLPEENIGSHKNILKNDLKQRIISLDPQGVYRKKYKKLIEEYLGPIDHKEQSERPLTITFAVGGAGAQRDLALNIVKSLERKIKNQEVNINLIAGSRADVYDFFVKNVEARCPGCKNVRVVYNPDKVKYFQEFNKVLRTTDILWTKPSELTFYSGLGLPIIMSKPIGSQEHYNREWLLAIGAGIDNKNVKYTDEWLFDWLNSGWLAEAAIQGFLDAPSSGAKNIEDVVLNKKIKEIDELHLL